MLPRIQRPSNLGWCSVTLTARVRRSRMLLALVAAALAVGLAVIFLTAGAAGADQNEPVVVQIAPTAKLIDAQTIEVRAKISCDPGLVYRDSSIRLIKDALEPPPGQNWFGPFVCDGRPHFYTSRIFLPPEVGSFHSGDAWLLETAVSFSLQEDPAEVVGASDERVVTVVGSPR
jgi:hypothetical protein